MALIKCSECNTEISDSAVACEKCGCPIMDSVKCPDCNTETSGDAVACENCGCPLKDHVCQYGNDIYIKIPDLSWWKKALLVYWITKRYILDEFTLKDGILTVTCKNGKSIQSKINDVKSTFEKNTKNDITTITIKTLANDKIMIADYAFTVTDEQWEQIFNILQPKEAGVSKVLGAVSKVMNVLDD